MLGWEGGEEEEDFCLWKQGEVGGSVGRGREAPKKTCLCLNYLAYSLCWFHRSLDFFQKCCFAKGV